MKKERVDRIYGYYTIEGDPIPVYDRTFGCPLAAREWAKKRHNRFTTNNPLKHAYY